MLRVLNDKFGNYVMQRLYEYSGGDLKVTIQQYILSRRNKLSPEGNYVLKFIEKLKKKKHFDK